MDMLDLFRLMASEKASDLFVTVGVPPSLKIDGQIRTVKAGSLSSEATRNLALSLMDDAQTKMFATVKDANFAVNPDGLGRFRVNVFQQQGQVGMVVRHISSHIPSFQELNLPSPALEKIALMRRGLALEIAGLMKFEAHDKT